MNEREKLVVRDEQRVNMMFEDVQREQSELTAMGDSIDADLAARELLAKSRMNGQGSLRKTRNQPRLMAKPGRRQKPDLMHVLPRPRTGLARWNPTRRLII